MIRLHVLIATVLRKHKICEAYASMLAKYIRLQPIIKNILSDSFSQNNPDNTRTTE